MSAEDWGAPPDEGDASAWIDWLTKTSHEGYVDVTLPGARVRDLIDALVDREALMASEDALMQVATFLFERDYEAALSRTDDWRKELRRIGKKVQERVPRLGHLRPPTGEP